MRRFGESKGSFSVSSTNPLAGELWTKQAVTVRESVICQCLLDCVGHLWLQLAPYIHHILCASVNELRY